MKDFYVSYFYQVRNMSKTDVPLSTAMSGPKWFFTEDGRSYIDKRGVVNGLRVRQLVPGKSCEGLCTGNKTCRKKPDSCDFLKAYRAQLDQIDFSEFLESCKRHEARIQQMLGTTEELNLIFMVYEAPSNPCSERVVLQQWFRDHGIELKEWHDAYQLSLMNSW